MNVAEYVASSYQGKDTCLMTSLQPQWGSYYSFKHHYKRIRASLSHRKYEAALSKITRNNDILASLTEQNVQAEPSRRRRRKSRAELQDLQHQARCLYDSLDMQCNCDYYHRTELRLNTRLNSEDQDQLSNLRFGYRIYIDDQSDDPLWYEFIARILETKPAKQLLSQKPSGADKTEKVSGLLLVLLQFMSLCGFWQVSSVGDKFLSILAGKPTSKDVKERKKKGVKFSGLSDPGDVSRRLGRELVKGSSMAFDNSSTIKIDYLCNEAQKLALTMSTGQSKGATKGLLGVLHRTASSRATVGIFIAPESHRDRRKATSLSRLLSGKTRDKKARLRLTLGNLTLGQGERLILALTLASNSLQLHGTRWLDDLRDKSSIMLDLGCVDDRTGAPEVYISKAFPDEDPKTQSQQSLMPFVILNPIIYNLGILLIEIYLGQTLESLRTEEDPLDHNGQANILTDLSTAMRLVDNIYSLAGTGYGDAVRRCLRGDFDSRCTDLNDESFRQAVYEKVVEPLEEDVKNFYRLGQESV